MARSLLVKGRDIAKTVVTWIAVTCIVLAAFALHDPDKLYEEDR
jgi:hypothetical protein